LFLRENGREGNGKDEQSRTICATGRRAGDPPSDPPDGDQRGRDRILSKKGGVRRGGDSRRDGVGQGVRRGAAVCPGPPPSRPQTLSPPEETSVPRLRGMRGVSAAAHRLSLSASIEEGACGGGLFPLHRPEGSPHRPHGGNGRSLAVPEQGAIAAEADRRPRENGHVFRKIPPADRNGGLSDPASGSEPDAGGGPPGGGGA